MKLYAFDLDGTLCDYGKGLLPETIASLRELEDRGDRVCICSGKPVFYLCGMLRQIGLREPIMIGENGGVVQFGVELPPEKSYHLSRNELAVSQLEALRKRLHEAFGDSVWYQPNEVEVTVFPKKREQFPLVAKYYDPKVLSECTVYPLSDCFDALPNDVAKSTGLSFVCSLLGIGPEDVVAVGDALNDIPMLTFAGEALGIRFPDPSLVHRNFDTIGDALDYLTGAARSTN